MSEVLGTAPILGPKGANIVDDAGKITAAARESLVINIVKLLQQGNKDGKGLLLSSALNVAMPPAPGPKLPTPSLTNPKAQESIFWFEPDPYASLVIPYLLDPNSAWSKIYVDGLYASIAKGLNLNGSYVPPIFDPTIFGIELDVKLDLQLDLPKLPLTLPTLIAPKIPDLLLKLKLPSLPIPAIPKIPSFTIPDLPAVPNLPSIPLPGIPIPTLAFPDLFINFFLELPTVVFPPKLPLSFPDLFLSPFNFLLDLFFSIAFRLNAILVSPKLLMATMLAILHNVAIMIGCDIVGSIFGTGEFVKTIARFGGLLA